MLRSATSGIVASGADTSCMLRGVPYCTEVKKSGPAGARFLVNGKVYDLPENTGQLNPALEAGDPFSRVCTLRYQMAF